MNRTLTQKLAYVALILSFAGCATDAEQATTSATVTSQSSGSESNPTRESDNDDSAASPEGAPSTKSPVAPAEYEKKEMANEPQVPAASPMAVADSPMASGKAAPAKSKAKLGRRSTRKRTGRSKGDSLVPRRMAPKPVAVQADSEQYTDYGVNQATDTKKDRFSTFSIDVDTGAYTIARRKLNAGQIPPSASVRVEEFVNYFGYDYPNPDNGAFGVHLEAAQSPFSADQNTLLLRVGVQGKRIDRAQRKAVHLTFLVDVSGSMRSDDKIGLAKQALTILTNNLSQGDTVALATYAGRVAEILPPTGMGNKGKILTALQNLQSGGGTGMNSGMELAYKLAMQNHERGDVNRVIVLSDGDANIGPVSHSEILKTIKSYVDEGITLSTIGFGMGNYKDSTMEQLANKGNGNYYYIDTAKEARKVFGEQLDGTLQVIAKDVKIQVEFDPTKVPEYRLIGYENRDIADKDFRNDRVDAGEIGAGHTVTALYEIKVNPEARTGKLATVRIRAKKPDGYKAEEEEFNFSSTDIRSRLSDTSKDFQFAAAVAAFAEILRKSPYSKHITLALVQEVAASSAGGRADREEFIALVKKAQALL